MLTSWILFEYIKIIIPIPNNIKIRPKIMSNLVNDLISTCLGVINLSIIEGKHRLRIVIVRDRNSFQVIKLVRVTLELKFMKTADDRRCSVINYRKRNTDLGAVAVYIGNNYRY